MAKGDGTTLEKLYIELGLDLSTLQSDILAADRTVTENLGRLNRERNLIKFRMQADISGLDTATDAAKIFEIQEKSLNAQLTISKDRLAILEAAYKQVASNQNSTALAIQNAEKQWQRERIEVGKLEAALKSLASQKVSIDTAHVHDSISKLTAKIKNIKIQAEIDTSKLKDAGSIFDAQKVHISAVTRELELQREKYYQLQRQAIEAAKAFGGDSSITLNLKSNFLQQYQEIQRLETKLKELQSTDINLKIRADNAQNIEQTISEKISRLNATIDLIRVKTEVDTSKISGATAEFDKAKRQVTALNQELTLQNSKLAEMQKLLSQSSGTKAINLAADIQKQIQSIDQLKAKIAELNSIQPPKSGLLSDYLGIKGDITGQLNNIATAFSQLKGATSSADNAIVSVLGVIDSIPSPVGKAITALAGLPVVFAGVENSIVDMMKATAASGDSVYVMSRGFQMSVADTGKFVTMAKTAGVEVNDLASTLKRVQQSIVRGGEDAKAEQWLKRYGESAFDANGKLKDLNEMTLTLSRALKRAQADGRGMEFILATMRNASADVITTIEDAEGVYEQASHIVKAGIANPTLAHEVQGNLNAMGQQAAQLGTNFNAALLPVANEIIPRMTERMGKMTQLITDNKDVILDLGRDFAEVWGNVESTIEKVGEGLGVLAEQARKNRVVRQTDSETVIERYKNDASVKSAKDLIEREIANGGYTDEDIKRLRSRNDLYLKEIKRAGAEYKSILEQRRKDFAEANKSILDKYKGRDFATATDLLKELTDAEREAIAAQPSEFFGSLTERVAALNLELKELNKTAAGTKNEIKSVSDAVAAGSQALEETEEQRLNRERAQKYYDEAASIRYKMNHSDYEGKLYDNYRWEQEQLAKEGISEQERLAILADFAAKNAQVEQERADKLQEIRDKIAAADKTAFENKLADIEKEKDSWIQAGMSKLEADELAQKKREQLEQEIADKVADIRQSINAEFQTNLEKQISAIQKEQQAWVDMGVAASEAAELAGQKMEQAFEKAVDKAKALNQSLEDKIFAQEHSQYENDVRKLQQEVAQKAQEYQKAGLFDENSRALLNRYYNNAMRDLNAKATKGGDYTKSPTGANAGFQFVDYTQAQQQNFGLFTDEKNARQSVIKSLTEEQRKRLEETGALEKIIAAQNSLADSTKQAAGNIQDAANEAANIEIIHGDQIDSGGTQSLDDILAEVTPKTELQQFGEQLKQVGESLPQQEIQDFSTATKDASDEQINFVDATKGSIEATKSSVEVTKDAATAQKNFSEMAIKARDALENFSEGVKKTDLDGAKKSGLRPENTDLQKLQTTPKDTSYKFEDLGFDLDVFSAFEGVLGSTAGALVAAGVGGLTAASLPALIAAGIGIAGLAAVVSGTSDNRDERLNDAGNISRDKNLSLDAGTLGDIDISEISSPLAGIETNVQGIRDILQGNKAVDDANAEATPDTSTENLSDILTPLGSIDETAKSILGELQNRQEETSTDAISEMQSEISTQLSEGASQITEGITAPIESLAQALEEIQTQNEAQDTATSEGASYLENVSSTVQSIWDEMQAAKETQSADAEGNDELTRLDDISGKIQSVFDEIQAWRTAESESMTQSETATETTDYLTPLTNIRDSVSGIWGKMQETTQTQDTAPQENLREFLSLILTNINAPISELRDAISNKQFELPKIEFPTEVIVQPLNNIATLIKDIISALSNREPPKIEVSPSMDIDLGGAYVFDDKLKTELVNDITSKIVTQITEAVERATASSSGSYGFGR